MASKVTEGDKTIHLVYLYNPAAEHPTRSINAALVSQGHAWLSPTSELDLTTEDYDGLAEQQEKLGGSLHESYLDSKYSCSKKHCIKNLKEVFLCNAFEHEYLGVCFCISFEACPEF